MPALAATISPKDILDAARALGILSGSASSAPRLLATLCQEGVEPREVARIIGQEPGLAARVLRVANSAFYGVPRAIATIDRAVVVLGLDAVRGIAAAACLDRSITRAGEPSVLDMTAFLDHSVATAAAAESLARIRHRAIAPEAFIAGLLHDLGTVLQLRLDAAGLAALVTVVRGGSDSPMSEIELQHVRVGHETCAAVLFEAWNLPAGITAAVANHHAPGNAPAEHRPLASLVYLGDRLALRNRMGFSAEIAPAGPDPAALAELGLGLAEFDAVGEKLPDLVATLQGALLG